MSEVDHDPVHSKMLKATVTFFAQQVANLFRMGRCAGCEGCAQSVLNLGTLFTKCLARELQMDINIPTVQAVPRGTAPGPSKPGGLPGGVN